VLLATLTLLHTSADETRSALRPALVGTMIGAVLAAGLFMFGAQPQVYVIVLPLVMLVGFAAGPVLGPGWAQAFTLVVAMIFAQVAQVAQVAPDRAAAGLRPPVGRSVGDRRLGYQTFADGLRRNTRVEVTGPPLAAEDWPTDLGTDLYHLADLRVWLTSLGDDLR
jgi:hypothetical protein